MTDSITNLADVAGTLDSLPLAVQSQAVVTPMSTDITIVKTADKQVWADRELTYTITVSNANATLDYETAVITDTIDPTKATLVDGSVTLNGTATDQYTYNETTGLLTVQAGTIAASGSGIVTFQVEKV